MTRPSLLLALAACSPEPAAPPTPEPWTYDEIPLTGWVDPRLGTSGSGNAIPGALVPHGMVRASPDTNGPPGRIQAYDASDTALDGFTHTQLEGPGGSANGYSQILVLPQTGPLNLDPATRAVPFSHDDEVARPGRYELGLQNGVHATLSATGHAAIHRYALPAGESRLLLDLGASQGTSADGEITVDGLEVRGFGTYVVHPFANLIPTETGSTGESTVYMFARLNLAPTDIGTFKGTEPSAGATRTFGAKSGAWVGWNLDAPTTVELRIGISMISEEHARLNLETEIGARSLDDVAAEADAAWNHVLNRIVIDADDDAKTMFYTALYRSAMQPADYTEAGGLFQTGASGVPVVRRAEGFRYYTDDWCLWDTFRTTHPLGALFEPERRGDILQSMLVPHEQGGWLDKCSWHATGYSRVMTGNPGVPVFADALVKGLDDFDTALAWEAVDKVGTQEIDPLPPGGCGYVNLGTPPEYIALGWVPDECDPGQSASMTLEHAYDDWTTARIAEALGRPDDAARYDARAGNWRNVWDPSTGFARPRSRSGAWRDPFDPAAWGDFVGFTEASSWVYSWLVPQDIPGLIEATGGQEAFIRRLDEFFTNGQFDPSNQPSFHVPFLYAHAGAPERTQDTVRQVVRERFGLAPGGLPGNDDAGAMSSWLVWAMLGLYPVTPGSPTYTLSVPLVRAAEIKLHPDYYAGDTIRIEVDGDPWSGGHVSDVTWNDAPVTSPALDHHTLANGGTLRIVLSDDPPAWGRTP